MTERGNITHRERKKQIAKFDGLAFGNKWPSDIDGIFDFGGKAFLVFELKSGDAPMKDGQRLLLQNMVDGWRDGGHQATAIVARHDAPIGCDIDAGAAVVSDLWFNRRWYQVNDGATLREMVERFLSKHAPGELRRLTHGTNVAQDAPQGANYKRVDTLPDTKTQTPTGQNGAIAQGKQTDDR